MHRIKCCCGAGYICWEARCLDSNVVVKLCLVARCIDSDVAVKLGAYMHAG